MQFLKVSIKLCNKVFELFFGSSNLYNCLAKFEVDIIDKAVIQNPVIIERKVIIWPKAKSVFSKYKYVDNKNMIMMDNVILFIS